jgi:Tfp pilus assembly protein PilV
MNQDHSIHPDSRQGTILLEALLATVVLVLSVLAFTFLFTSNTARMAKARDKRELAVFADNILTSLRAQSDESARTNNWRGFWVAFTNNSTGVIINQSSRLPVRYTLSVDLTTDRAAVLAQAWHGEQGSPTPTNSVTFYAEFWDSGAL